MGIVYAKTTISALSTRSSTTNNIVINFKPVIINKYVDDFDKVISIPLLKRGKNAVYKSVLDKYFRDDDGNLIITCTDYSRQIFKWKNEDGDVITDPKLTFFREQYVDTNRVSLQTLEAALYALEQAIHLEAVERGGAVPDCFAFDYASTAALQRPDFRSFVADKSYTAYLEPTIEPSLRA